MNEKLSIAAVALALNLGCAAERTNTQTPEITRVQKETDILRDRLDRCIDRVPKTGSQMVFMKGPTGLDWTDNAGKDFKIVLQESPQNNERYFFSFWPAPLNRHEIEVEGEGLKVIDADGEFMVVFDPLNIDRTKVHHLFINHIGNPFDKQPRRYVITVRPHDSTKARK